jgi:hypothetical protein
VLSEVGDMSVVNKRKVTIAGIAVVAMGLFGLYRLEPAWWGSIGSARFVPIQELPEYSHSCDRPTELTTAPEQSQFSTFKETPVCAQDCKAESEDLNPSAVRNIWDGAPIFGSAGVDTQRNEVYLQDTKKWRTRVFGRQDSAKPSDPPNGPRRMIAGPNSEIQFNTEKQKSPDARHHYERRDYRVLARSIQLKQLRDSGALDRGTHEGEEPNHGVVIPKTQID